MAEVHPILCRLKYSDNSNNNNINNNNNNNNDNDNDDDYNKKHTIIMDIIDKYLLTPSQPRRSYQGDQ